MSGKRYFPTKEGEAEADRTKRVINEKRQRTSGKLSKKNMEQMQKAHALCIVDFLGGNMRQAALMTGHSVAELQQWREELEGKDHALKFARYKIATNVEGVLVNYIQSMAILALEKSRTATLREVNTCISIAARQVGNLNTKNEKRTVKQRKKNELKPHKKPEELVVEPAEPAPVAEAEPALAPAELTERAKWENIVSQAVAESYQKGEPLKREDVINALISQRPESKPFLMPDSVDATDVNIQEWDN